jgi:glycosyltransferase involved in cell wall biosynthesis
MAARTVMLLNRDLALMGGVGRAHLTFVRHHDPERVRLTLACLMAPSDADAATFASAGAPVACLGDGYLAPAVRLRALLRERSVEVVVCSSLRSYLLAKYASRGLPCRVVYWLHSIAFVIKGPVRKLLFRAASRSDVILCVSDAVRRAHDLDRHHLAHVVYHGIDDVPTELHDRQKWVATRTRLGIAPDDVVIGYVAAFIEWKDHPTLLQAFAAALGTFPRLRLILLGDGPRREAVRDLASSLVGGTRVHFMGERNDVRQMLEIMDLYVHPSRGEGFGLAVVEAMLAGLPVITSDEGAFPEYVIDRETGLTFPGGDVGALAAAILTMAQDPQARASLGAAGRAQCLTRFSPSAFARRFTDAILAEPVATSSVGRSTGGRAMDGDAPHGQGMR